MEGDGKGSEPVSNFSLVLGEIIEKRSWPLIAIVFIFALFLAAAPLLFIMERSPYSQALATYNRLCQARGNGNVLEFRKLLTKRHSDVAGILMSQFQCYETAMSKSKLFEISADQNGAKRWLLIIEPPQENPLRLRFVDDNGILKWDPEP